MNVSVDSQIGKIQIANEVVAIISGTAALEVDGVVAGGMINEASARFTKRNFARGVKVDVQGDKAAVDIAIFVKFGFKMHEVSEEVQKRVKIALETMIGMTVEKVNVSVVGVQFDKLPKNKQIPHAKK